MSEYSIVDFLEALADDDLEKKLLRLVSEGLEEDKLLDRILELLGGKQA
jgi:hypothetical protein